MLSTCIQNIDMLQVPTIDSSLWNVLDRQSRVVDLILQRYMSNIATCMVPVLQIVDVLQSQTSADDRTALKQRLNQVKALSLGTHLSYCPTPFEPTYMSANQELRN